MAAEALGSAAQAFDSVRATPGQALRGSGQAGAAKSRSLGGL